MDRVLAAEGVWQSVCDRVCVTECVWQSVYLSVRQPLSLSTQTSWLLLFGQPWHQLAAIYKTQEVVCVREEKEEEEEEEEEWGGKREEKSVAICSRHTIVCSPNVCVRVCRQFK